MSTFFRILSYLSLCFFVLSCANQRPPTGGERDETPPELISSNPKHESLNFNGEEIELVFNELVQLKEAKSQLIITPRISDEYEIKFKKERVLIELAEPLDSNTTYTFSFREAVQDLNEGNPVENLKLAFSTGDYLDSLSISGRVYNLLTDKPSKDFTVSLYQIRDTLNPLEHPPLYLIKTDEEGNFLFENLRSDSYHLVALNDKNKNLIIDSKSEAFGFLSDTLDLVANIDSLEVATQLLDVRPFEFQGTRQTGTVLNLKFNKFVRDYSLTTRDSLNLVSNYSAPDRNSVQVFNTVPIQDSLFTIVRATDTLFQTISDTTYIRFEETNRDPKEMTASFSMDYVPQSTRRLEAEIKFSKPITTINYDSVYIYLDSLNIIPLDSSHFQSNLFNDEFTLAYEFDKSLFESSPESKEQTQNPSNERIPDKKTISKDSTVTAERDTTTTKTNAPKADEKPHIFISKYSFISVEEDSSKQIKEPLNFKRTENLATLLFEVDTQSPSYILQVLTKKGKVVREYVNQSSGTINSLEPGEFQLRLIIDENQNGIWDPGNYYKRQQPEPIVFYRNSEDQKLITLRANWEVGPLVIQY